MIANVQRVAFLIFMSSMALAACSGTAATTAGPTATAQVRAVHGSPDAGPVDIYVYAGPTRPSTPTVAGATYPQITGYLTVPVASYTVDVLAKGAASTSAAVASEKLTLASNVQYSVVVGGKVANSTLRFINFVEPAETSGQSALIVHHASPFVASAIAPVGVGVYNDATSGNAPPASATEVFAFNLASPSGPATSGAQPVDGEYFLSPLPSTLPTAIGFAAGAPSTPGSPLTSVAVYATASQLAAGLANPTSAQQTLAADTSEAVPAGAHISIFAIDTTSAAQLIGTLDP